MNLDEFGTAPLFTDPLADAPAPVSTPSPADGGPGAVLFQDARDLRPSQISRSEHTNNVRKSS
ncbi:UNVERIFIED_ORG: hypothetical protein ABIB19_003211 [Arthrobacter sp. UYEF10]